jgi:signal transduction histidine kinase
MISGEPTKVPRVLFCGIDPGAAVAFRFDMAPAVLDPLTCLKAAIDAGDSYDVVVLAPAGFNGVVPIPAEWFATQPDVQLIAIGSNYQAAAGLFVFADHPPADLLAQTIRLMAERRLLRRLLEGTSSGAARHSQKLEAVGRVAAGVAHDFNNLLTVIDGYTGLLLQKPDLQPSAREDVRKIAHAAESAAALTRKLLAFSSRKPLQPRPVELNSQVLALQEMLTRLVGDGVEMRFELGPGNPTVNGDPAGIEQIILNFLLNARDAMPNGGVVKIRTAVHTISFGEMLSHSDARPGRFVELAVEDTGIGMDRATQGRIFEPFFSTKEPGKGTGLGLSTVKEIVKLHGGWVEVTSKPGEGSCFKAQFPLSETADSPVERRSAAPASGQAVTVLLVEDEDTVRSLGRLILRRAGYQVIEAVNGDTALEIWKERCPEIGMVLTDMIMPGALGGRDLARELRKDRPDIPVLFTSGFSAEVVNGDLLAQELFLPKPYGPAALIEKVRECLERARSPQQ